MKVTVVTFAHSNAIELVHMINSCASTRHEVTYHLHLHSRNPDVVAICDGLFRRPDVCYFPHGSNRGLARSMNDSLIAAYRDGAELVVNSNDDSLWSKGDLDRLIAFAAAHPEVYAVTCQGSHAGRAIEDMGYCAVAFNPIAWRLIGCFDQNYFPAYFEDVDYDYRAALLGLTKLTCEGTFVQHKGGTIYRNDALMTQHHKTFTLNREYYIRKWGGLPDQEQFSLPFEQFPLYLPPEQRDCAYPGYDRIDQEIVVL